MDDVINPELTRSLDEVKILMERIENNIDEDGNNILDTYPYLVSLTPPVYKYPAELFEWLPKNVHTDNFLHAWPDKIYFKCEEDAMGFKLAWL